VTFFLIGSYLCGIAHTMPELIVFRAVQALGSAGMVPLSITIIGDVTTPAERPHYLGYISAVWGFAAIVAPLIGAWLIQHLSWSYVFWMPIPVGAVVMLFVGFWFQETGKHHHQEGPRPSYVALDLWRTPVVRVALLSGFLCGVLLMSVTAFVPTFLTGVLDQGPMAGGLALGLMSVSWTTTNMTLSRIMRKFRYRSLASIGSVIAVLACAGLALAANAQQVVAVYGACLCLGFGLGANSITFNVAVQSNVPGRERGQATTLFYLARTLGQALGATLLGWLLDLWVAAEVPGLGAVDELMRADHRSPEVAMALAHGLDRVFLCGVAISLTVLAASLITPKTLHASYAVEH
jgi:MFS family permease